VPEDRVITFTSLKPGLPLPDPRYLALHAAVAKVVHMAGMTEFLDGVLTKYERIRVVSDESGSEYLAGLLRATQNLIVY
jgi:hypothetical protein